MLTENQYQPLPNCLTIKESEIHGNGLFALSDIPVGTDLGESHYRCSESSEIKRTPLGGFIIIAKTVIANEWEVRLRFILLLLVK